jgi:hypothetical protein
MTQDLVAQVKANAQDSSLLKAMLTAASTIRDPPFPLTEPLSDFGHRLLRYAHTKPPRPVPLPKPARRRTAD